MNRLGSILVGLILLFASAEARAQAAIVTISFNPTTIGVGGESTLTIQINNIQTGPLSSGAIASFSYAAGVVNSSAPDVVTSNCGGAESVTATPGAGSMSASNISIPASQSCFIFIDVTASSGGSYTSTFPSGGWTASSGPNLTPSSATLTVNAPFVVTNANDSGAGSLRQAILDVNANCASGPWTIEFNISGSAVIKPTTPLPAVTCANTVINGYTQPGSSANTSAPPGFDAVLPVTIDGSLCTGCVGIELAADGVHLKGLAITSTAGVKVNTPQFFHNVYLWGNRIGVNTIGVDIVQGFANIGDASLQGSNEIHTSGFDGVRVCATCGSLIDTSTVWGSGGSGVAVNDSFQDTYLFDSMVFNNTGRGIGMSAGTTANVILIGTSSWNNGGMGFDLGNDGPTPNDEAAVPYDQDTGPNDLQNYPVVTSVVHSGGNTVITGHLKGESPGANALIELFSNLEASTPTTTFGQTLIASFNAVMDASGLATFTQTVSGTHDNISAHTTIDTCGDGCVVSSEFSPTVAAALPAVTLAPATLTFSPQTVGTTSAPQTVTLTNTGTSDLSIATIGTTGDFGQTNNCPATLGANGTCQIDVTFTPLVAGTRTGQLKVFSNASGSPHIVGLSGDGVSAAAPAITLSSNSLSFPDTFVGGTSGSQLVVVTNTGNAPLVIEGVSGTSEDFPFTTSCVGVIAPSGSCDINARFQPTATGSRSGSILIFSNVSGSPHSISVSGNGVEQPVGILTVSPSSIVFPSTVNGTQSAIVNVTLTNTGGADVVVSSITVSAQFALVGTCGTIAPSGTCTIGVRFTPTQLGNIPGTLTIQSNASTGTVTVSLSGVSIANPLPEARLSLSSIGFGNRFVGTPSAPQLVTLTNVGLAPLAISSISTTGDFTQSSNCPATLAPAASCQISVTFLARLAGVRIGTLRVFTNAAGSPAQVALSGTGCRMPSLSGARLGLNLSCVPGS